MVDNNVRPESVPSRFVKRDGKTGGKVWKILRDQIFMIFLYYMARFGLVGRPATLVVSTNERHWSWRRGHHGGWPGSWLGATGGRRDIWNNFLYPSYQNGQMGSWLKEEASSTARVRYGYVYQFLFFHYLKYGIGYRISSIIHFLVGLRWRKGRVICGPILGL